MFNAQGEISCKSRGYIHPVGWFAKQLTSLKARHPHFLFKARTLSIFSFFIRWKSALNSFMRPFVPWHVFNYMLMNSVFAFGWKLFSLWKHMSQRSQQQKFQTQYSSLRIIAYKKVNCVWTGDEFITNVWHVPLTLNRSFGVFIQQKARKQLNLEYEANFWKIANKFLKIFLGWWNSLESMY